MLLSIFPVLSILLLCTSLWLMIKLKKQTNPLHSVFLFLNGIFLLSLIAITISFLAMYDLTIIPPWVYWILIIAGIVTGIVSFIIKNVPGQLMSAGLLLFTGFVALFSIGVILLTLFIIQLIVIAINLKRYGWESA